MLRRGTLVRWLATATVTEIGMCFEICLLYRINLTCQRIDIWQGASNRTTKLPPPELLSSSTEESGIGRWWMLN